MSFTGASFLHTRARIQARTNKCAVHPHTHSLATILENAISSQPSPCGLAVPYFSANEDPECDPLYMFLGGVGRDFTGVQCAMPAGFPKTFLR